MTHEPLLVFYDGACGLCTRAVAWALARDRHGRLEPEPFQSPGARELLRAHGATPADAARELHVWSRAEGLRRGPDAVAAMLARLPGYAWLGALLGATWLAPLARPAYAFVASRRGWFGAPVCALPARRGSRGTGDRRR